MVHGGILVVQNEWIKGGAEGENVLCEEVEDE